MGSCCTTDEDKGNINIHKKEAGRKAAGREGKNFQNVNISFVSFGKLHMRRIPVH